MVVPAMRAEFTRYGMARHRPLVAMLQLAGAMGLLVGLRYPPLGVAAASGLAAMMGVALVVRFRIGDSLAQCIPAAGYFLLNVYLVAGWLGR